MHFTTNVYDTGSYNPGDVYTINADDIYTINPGNVYTINAGDDRPIRIVFEGQTAQNIIDVVNGLTHTSQQAGVGFDSFATLLESLIQQGAFMSDFSDEFSDELDESEELSAFLEGFAIKKEQDVS